MVTRQLLDAVYFWTVVSRPFHTAADLIELAGGYIAKSSLAAVVFVLGFNLARAL